MRQIVRDRLQSEWWVNCSLEQVKAGFQTIRKKIDVSLRFPYQLTQLKRGFFDPVTICSRYLGDGHWVSLEWDGRVRFWRKMKPTLPVLVVTTSLLNNLSSICKISSARYVLLTNQRTWVVNLDKRKIQELHMPPNYAVFRWSENQVVFATLVKKVTELRCCSIGDTRSEYTADIISLTSKVSQFIPCSEKSGILSTPRGVFVWNHGSSCTSLQSSPVDTFWTILPLNHQKIVVRDGLEAKVRVWDTEQSKEERRYVYSSQLQMTKLPNASFLLYAHNETRTLFVDPRMPKPVLAFTSPQKGFTSVVWTGNGPYVVTSYDKNIHFWDMRRYQIIQSMVLPKAMRIVDSMASGDLFLQDSLNCSVALLTPPSILKNPQDKTR